MKNLLKVIVIIILSFFIPVCLLAQIIDTAWTSTYGGTDDEEGYSVQQTTDGGYVIAGNSDSYGAGGHDVYLIKADSLGDTLWTRTYGGFNSDYGHSVQQTTDGGYIVAGLTWSYGAGEDDVYLIKTDSLGNPLWAKTYGGDGRDAGLSVCQTYEGGYIVAGNSDSYGAGEEDVYLIKTDSLGDTLWTKTYGGAGWDRANSVQQTSDGGYIVTGINNYDIYLIKTDSMGDTLWTKTYGGPGIDGGYSTQQTTKGEYIIAGYTRSYGAGLSDVYLIKTDSLGDTLWTKCYGGASDDQGRSIQQTTDGGYIVAGYTASYSVGENDMYIIKTDSLGDTLWTRVYGGIDYDAALSVQQTSDGGYIVTGFTDPYGADGYDVYLIKLEFFSRITVSSPNGGEEWQADSVYDITWMSSGTSGGVKIEHSLNNGLNWTEIVASMPDTGAYPWTIPDTMSYNCLIRISDTNGTLSDISDSVFTIYSDPFIIVTSPNGGEIWKVDSTYDITWVSAGTSGGVKIECSINNGLDWAEIIASTPDSGSYIWNPPDTLSDSCLVSISDTNGSISDTSDSVFSIIAGSGVPIDSLEVYALNIEAIATGSQVEFTYTLPEKTNNIKFTLYNVVGLKIKEENLKESPAGYYSGRINMNSISKGIYFIRMEVGGGKFTQTKKFLLM